MIQAKNTAIKYTEQDNNKLFNQELISKTCDEIKELLLEKNKSYGNSVFKPINLFSKLTASEQINVRIDDKLNRLKNGNNYNNEDTILDLIGYLIIKHIIDNEMNKKSND